MSRFWDGYIQAGMLRRGCVVRTEQGTVLSLDRPVQDGTAIRAFDRYGKPVLISLECLLKVLTESEIEQEKFPAAAFPEG